MPVNCIHALCAVLPLIASPIDSPKTTQPMKRIHNPSPWEDAKCRPIDHYVTYDPSGFFQGRSVSIDVVNRVPEMKWENKTYCYSKKMDKEGYF